MTGSEITNWLPSALQYIYFSPFYVNVYEFAFDRYDLYSWTTPQLSVRVKASKNGCKQGNTV